MVIYANVRARYKASLYMKRQEEKTKVAIYIYATFHCSIIG